MDYKSEIILKYEKIINKLVYINKYYNNVSNITKKTFEVKTKNTDVTT